MRVACVGPLVRVVDGVLLVKMKELERLPLVSMMKMVGFFLLVRTMRVGGDFFVRVEAVVLVRLVSVSPKTEYSPGKSCV